MRNSCRRVANTTCPLGLRRFDSYRLREAVSSEARAGDNHSVSLVSEPVEARRGQQGLTESLEKVVSMPSEHVVGIARNEWTASMDIGSAESGPVRPLTPTAVAHLFRAMSAARSSGVPTT